MKKLTYLNEVDEMIVLVVGTDGGQELLEWSLHSSGQCPGFHIESCFLELLPEMISVSGVSPLDVMSACLNQDICCPGGEDCVVFLDVVYLGHSEDVVFRVGVEGTGESDIVHCGLG